jgi:hypothetical protein
VAAAAAQASVSIVAFGLPAVGPDLREAYGLSLTMLGAALAIKASPEGGVEVRMEVPLREAR